MALFGLLGGGNEADMYGDLFTETQRAALANRSQSDALARFAAVMSKAGQTSRLPQQIPWGEALGALGGGQDEASERMLKAMQTAEAVRAAQSTRALQDKLKPLLLRELEKRNNLPSGSLGPGAGVSAPAPPAAAPVPPGATPAVPPVGAPNAPAATPPAAPAAVPNDDLASLWGIPGDPLGAPSAAPPPGGPPTQAERLAWAKTVGPGGPYLPLEDWVAKQRAGAPAAPSGGGPQDQVIKPQGGLLDAAIGQMAGGFDGGGGLLSPASYGGAANGGLPFRLAAASSSPGAGGDGAATSDDPRGLVPYIRQQAIARGIDPDVAVRVAQSEGLSNPVGDSGKSHGAFQLYTGGGMGNEFQRATGLNPADPRNERATIDYALDNVRRTGWTPFHGAAGAGIGPRTGIDPGAAWASAGARGERPGDVVLPSGGGGGGDVLSALLAMAGGPGGNGDNDPLAQLAQMTSGGGGTPRAAPAVYEGGGEGLPIQQTTMALAPYATGNAVPGGPSSIEGVSPRLSSKLETAIAAMPPDVREQFLISSGFRNAQRQAQVNPSVTNSRHMHGAAVDLASNPAVLNWFNQNPQYGLGFPLQSDPKERNHLEEIDPQTGGRLPIMNVQYNNPLSNLAQQPPGQTGSAAGGEAVIPGTDWTPRQLSALNALTEMAKLGTPFKGLLETYYKSPEYLSTVKAAESTAEFGVKKQFEPGLQADILRATMGPKIELKEKEEIINRRSKEIEQDHDLFNKLQIDFAAKDGLRMEKQPDGKITLVPIPGVAQQRTQNAQDIATATKRGEADYTFVDTTVKFPGEAQEREMKMSVADYNKLNAGQEVTVNGVKIPAMSGITLGKQVYTPQQTAEIQARGTAQAEMYKSGQKALDTAHEAVRGANQRAPYYGNMLAAMQGFQPGATAEARLTGMQYLKDLGIIKGDNVPQGEAIKLAGERLAFLALPPGQGSWAIAERQMLKNSIGSMSLSPGGLTDAIRMMQQLDDYDRKVSEIHRQVADENKGLPNLLEAQRRVEKLGPPLTAAQQNALQSLQQQPAAGTPAGGATAPPTAPAPPAVGEVRGGRRFRGGNPSDPNNWPKVE
jgi:hypothetical protein